MSTTAPDTPAAHHAPYDIGKLLAPRTVALVGASDERHYARSIIANLRQHGFADSAILPVNPRHDTVAGLPCHPDLGSLPAPPDATALLIGRGGAQDMLRAAARAGSGAALVIADGYAEESPAGLARQRALGDVAREAGIALLGPNTLGYVVPATGAGMWCAGALPAPLTPGGTVVLAQSSGMLNLLMTMASRRLLGIRACVSVGNAETIGMPELVDHFAADPDATVLGLVMESTDRPRALAAALARARDAGKPVVMLKIGVSDLGRRNAVAHTGRMAGPERGWQALFDRLGVCTVGDLDDLVETLTLFGGLATALPPRALDTGRLGLAFATISGGETSLICDIAAQEGVTPAELAPDTLASVRAGLGKESMIGNPMDLQNTRTTRPEVFWAALRAVCADDSVDVLAVRLNLGEHPTPALEKLYADVAEVTRGAGKGLLVLTRAYEHLDLAWWRYFASLGVPFVLSYRNALRGLGRLTHWLADRPRTPLPPGAVPELAGGDEREAVPLTAGEARDWLRAAGIAYIPSALAATPEEAGRAAADLGFPAVLKAVAPGLVHKSEAGGVALGLADRAAVEAAAGAMAASVAAATGLAPERVGFEVQRMAGEGVEIIVGAVPDPTWGPVVMVGAGGIHAETLGDVAWDLPPLTPGRVRELLRGLRVWPVLDGARGRPRADTDALADLVAAFSEAVVRDAAVLGGVDLNPVVVGPEGTGAHAVDAAVLRTRPPGAPGAAGERDA
ncbi:acetate--CoA ligase family protein [Streptomyces sp. NPDC050560]|uniref:acetate--CoA ligase family protein n=1 Tax=Streptomyces sp. NPDC050560 TaxID=3365630 RepID=UPI0037931854